MSFILLALILAGIAAAIYWSPHPWKDDGDCMPLAWHTIRIPELEERYLMWRGKFYVLPERPTYRIVLPPSKILAQRPWRDCDLLQVAWRWDQTIEDWVSRP